MAKVIMKTNFILYTYCVIVNIYAYWKIDKNVSLTLILTYGKMENFF